MVSVARSGWSPSLSSAAAFIFLGYCFALASSCGQPDFTPTDSSTLESQSSADLSGATAVSSVRTFNVSGQDGRGPFKGRGALYSQDGKEQFVRCLDYGDSVVVANDRRLSWCVQGLTSSTSQPSGYLLKASLKKGNAIVQQGALKRTIGDFSLPGFDLALTSTEAGGFDGHIVSEIASNSETWVPAQDLTLTSILPTGTRVLENMHAALPDAVRAPIFANLTGYHALPGMAPYRDRADFKQAVHKRVIDTVDLAWYKKNPSRIRVINTVVDDISIQESLARANAFRWSFAQKQVVAEAEQRKFIDPRTGVVSMASVNGTLVPDGDGALWLGIYAASQAYRFDVTGSAEALANLKSAVDALIRHQEITGDPKIFARTLRPAGVFPADPAWRRGTGPHANLEWAVGGNNDMIKGLFYGYAAGYSRLCKGQPGNDGLCLRLRYNAKVLAEQNEVARKNTNLVLAYWLASAVLDGMDRLRFRLLAEAAWAAAGNYYDVGTIVTDQGVADWSGLNLAFVSYDTLRLLQLMQPLSSNSGAIANGAKANTVRVDEFRNPLWNIAESVFGTPNTVRNEKARQRLQEYAVPKPLMQIDHRVSPEFSKSPYPALPWKNDFLTNEGRQQSLYSYPLFETAHGNYAWKDGALDYKDPRLNPNPYTDYLYAYWLMRKAGVLSAAD